MILDIRKQIEEMGLYRSRRRKNRNEIIKGALELDRYL